MELQRKSSAENAAVLHPTSFLNQRAAASCVILSENPQPSSNSNPSQPQQEKENFVTMQQCASINSPPSGSDFFTWPGDDSFDEDECLEDSTPPMSIEEQIYFTYLSFRMHLRPGALKEELARKSSTEDMESKAEIAEDYLLGLGCSKEAVEEVFRNNCDFLDWLFTHHFGAGSNGRETPSSPSHRGPSSSPSHRGPSSSPSHREPLTDAKTIAPGHLEASQPKSPFQNKDIGQQLSDQSKLHFLRGYTLKMQKRHEEECENMSKMFKDTQQIIRRQLQHYLHEQQDTPVKEKEMSEMEVHSSKLQGEVERRCEGIEQQQRGAQSTAASTACFHNNGSSGAAFQQPHHGNLKAGPWQQELGGTTSAAGVMNSPHRQSDNVLSQRGFSSFDRPSVASSFSAAFSQHPFFSGGANSDDMDTSDGL